MKNLQNSAAFLFIVATIILGVIAILGVWQIFGQDVVIKSSETFGLLALVAVIILVAGHFMEARSQVGELAVDQAALIVSNPAFKSIRRGTVGALVTSVSVLALFGVLSIWNVIANQDVLSRSLSSVAIIAFASFVIIVTCLDRENSPLLRRKDRSPIVTILFALILIYLLFSVSRFFF